MLLNRRALSCALEHGFAWYLGLVVPLLLPTAQVIPTGKSLTCAVASTYIYGIDGRGKPSNLEAFPQGGYSKWTIT